MILSILCLLLGIQQHWLWLHPSVVIIVTRLQMKLNISKIIIKHEDKKVYFCFYSTRLVGICGTVGSGKSSLVCSVMGQTRIQKGTIGIEGSMAYVPQQAWIFHATVRENITFGKPFVQEKYDEGK